MRRGTFFIFFVFSFATVAEADEKVSATKILLDKVIQASVDQNKDSFNNAFSQHNDKIGDQVYVKCDGENPCVYSLQAVKQHLLWKMFDDVGRCDQSLKDRANSDQNYEPRYLNCTSKKFKPFSGLDLISADTSPITQIYDKAERELSGIKEKEKQLAEQVQKEEDERVANEESLVRKREQEVLTSSKTPAGILKKACEAHKEYGEMFAVWKETEQALREQGLNKRQVASATSTHATATEMSGNKAHEFRRQYLKLTGKEINWKRDCK